MNDHKPFSEHWWWQVLLDHIYLCKWKYYDLEEMKADSELTDFIIRRLKIAQGREIVGKIHNKKRTPTIEGPDGRNYVDKEEVFSIIQETYSNAYILNSDEKQ